MLSIMLSIIFKYNIMFSILYIYLLLNVVYSYGFNIHKYLGKLTDVYLNEFEPILYNKILNILDSDIASISSWADKIKRKKEYDWSRQLHYIDILECRKDLYTKDIIDKYCENNCVVSALQNFTYTLKYNLIQPEMNLTNADILKFIIHFIQDISQPMHLLGYEKGGNSLKLIINQNNKNRTTNLHFLWDTMLPEFFIKKYTYHFPKICINNVYNNLDNNLLGNLDNILLDILNKNIKQVACKIYPDTDYIVFDEYFNSNYFITLFDNYYFIMISTLKYIFN